ncbi:MAG: hypothetical protein IPP88_05860 [Betaproteobacteria bacterium]|nr:hypothetical protein [Betaproteobacteria bacterium]
MRHHSIRYPARGFILLLIVLTLTAIGAAALFVGIGANLARRTSQSATVDQQLQISRDALIGFAIGTFGGGARPGQMPRPDSLQNSNYDGQADSGCLDGAAANGLPALTGNAAKSASLRCIGRLPWKKLGLQFDVDTVDNRDEFDVLGQMPWYAVSANLADPNLCLQYLNSGTVAQLPVSFVCPSLTAPPFPWLKVCDESGRLINDRVAFVVFFPGAPIVTQGRTQSRTGTPRPQPVDFLDGIPVPAGWSALPANQRCTTYDNAGLTNEFVVASTSATFNDRLAFVTIDELLSEVEKRVAVELREAIETFRKTRVVSPSLVGAYPWLVPITDPVVPSSNVAVPTTFSGFVPFHTAHTGQGFLSELGWTLPAGAIAVSPSPPNFSCFGASTCRLRTAAGGVIPNTVTTAAVDAITNYDLTAPVATCKWTNNANQEAKCGHTFMSTTSPTYRLERLVSSIWTNLGNVTGTQTRNVTVDFSSFVGAAGTSVAATTTSVFQRSVTKPPASTTGMLSIQDTFIDSSGTMAAAIQVGFGETAGFGTTTVRRIRAYQAMPVWYFAEKWYEYSFAVLSSDVSPTLVGVNCSANCLEAGPRKSLDAIVAMTGAPLAGQNRNQASPPLAAFLEDVNATSLTIGATFGKFNAVGTPKTAVYNDAIATLPP